MIEALGTGFVIQVPRVLLKRNSYLVSTSYNIFVLSILKCLLSDTILIKLA